MKKMAFVNPKGGVGKTTFCDQLAFNFKENGLEVQVADLDSQQGTYFHARVPEPTDPDILLVDTKGALDIGSNIPATISDVIEDVDLVVIPTQLQRDSVEALPKVVSMCEAHSTPYIIVPSIVKMSRTVDQTQYANICRDYPGRICSTMIRECTDINKARDVLYSVNDVSPKSNAAKDFDALADEIMKELMK